MGFDDYGNPFFDTGIQKSISDQYKLDKERKDGNLGLFRVHDITFEPAHQKSVIPECLRFSDGKDRSKPFNANLYWKNVLKPNIDHPEIDKVPIIRYLREIIEH